MATTEGTGPSGADPGPQTGAVAPEAAKPGRGLGSHRNLVLALAMARIMDWPFVLAPFWILVAFGISMGIGVVFGFYPARKAARMNPIDALRFE